MTHSIAVVAFDFDGTLADTQPAVVKTVAQTLASLRLPDVPADEVVQRMGLPLHQVLAGVGVAAPLLEEAVRAYRAAFSGNAREVRLFDGVAQCLAELEARGVALAIVSSRGRESLRALLLQLGIADRFALVLGDEDAARKKPAPDLVLAAAERLRSAAQSVLVVGDTTFDIAMGRAAGALTCAVSYGSHAAEPLRAAQPTVLLESIAALPAWIDERSPAGERVMRGRRGAL